MIFVSCSMFGKDTFVWNKFLGAIIILQKNWALSITPPPQWNGMRFLGLSASLLAGGQLVKPENPRSGADPRKVQM